MVLAEAAASRTIMRKEIEKLTKYVPLSFISSIYSRYTVKKIQFF